jgi:H+/Cl- antiporter ClcA
MTQHHLVGTSSTYFHPLAYAIWVVFSLICAGIAGALTIYLAPKATGSGIPELMGILNGVEIKDFISYKVLAVKCLGVCLAVAATLCIGKEGPLAHIGAMIAVLTIYLPISWMK